MSVYVDQDDALDRMAVLEGDRWAQRQVAEPDDPFNFLRFKAEWEKGNYRRFRGDPGVADMCIDVVDDRATNCAIYGQGGWNRYFVTFHGEILFSRGHATEEGVRAAEAAGFRVF